MAVQGGGGVGCEGEGGEQGKQQPDPPQDSCGMQLKRGSTAARLQDGDDVARPRMVLGRVADQLQQRGVWRQER